MFRISICLLAAAALAFADDEQHIHKVVKAAGASQVNVEVDNGAIHIHPGTGTSVEVDVVFRGGRRSDIDKALHYYNLDVDQFGSDVRVKGRFQEGHKPFVNDPVSFISWLLGDSRVFQQIEYDISVPSQVGASLQTSGGSIEADGLARTVKARTSGGSIRLWELKGTVDAETSGGSITMEQIDGFVHAHTSGGALRLRDLAGGVEASTSGGGVTASFAEQPARASRLETSGGGITVGLGDRVHVDLNASTSGGRVTTDFAVPIERHHPTELHTQLNGGGPELYLHTSGGGIRIFHGDAGRGRGRGPNIAN